MAITQLKEHLLENTDDMIGLWMLNGTLEDSLGISGDATIFTAGVGEWSYEPSGGWIGEGNNLNNNYAQLQTRAITSTNQCTLLMSVGFGYTDPVSENSYRSAASFGDHSLVAGAGASLNPNEYPVYLASTENGWSDTGGIIIARATNTAGKIRFGDEEYSIALAGLTNVIGTVKTGELATEESATTVTCYMMAMWDKYLTEEEVEVLYDTYSSTVDSTNGTSTPATYQARRNNQILSRKQSNWMT